MRFCSRMAALSVILNLIVLLAPPLRGAEPQFLVASPPNRIVFQRGLSGDAIIPVAGQCSLARGMVEARFVPVAEPNKPGKWLPVGKVTSDGSFRGHLKVSGGWYSLELRARAKTGRNRFAKVERVGAGEVFVVVGHSVAHGGKLNLPGAEDDRVNTVALTDTNALRDYEKTAELQYLPPLVGSHFSSDVRPAPFGHGTYFWGQFAQHVAKNQNVPVLIFNAAFGGTSLEHWAKSANGIPFEHSFVKSKIRMPYINVYNTLKRYVAVTGVRAILADQGQNDWPENDEAKVFRNYGTWIAQAREDFGFPELAIVVNRQTPPPAKSQIRRVQDRMIREYPYCFPGPDYDRLQKADTSDGIHLTESGAIKAAQYWADALDNAFFKKAVPFQPPR
ncbi:MAG: hypothetical protein JWM16_863 [Verrucomicrobiales bacterium]|nr:hypothetical protein [Verrucomicrobiales bacterium]